MPSLHEDRYLRLLLEPLESSADHKPQFGRSNKVGVSLEQFKEMYGSDLFYHWVGLDDDLMYAAHKAAGGMTSIYVQLGRGVDRLFRAIIQDSLGLSEEQVAWSYEITKKDSTIGVLTLDARIDLAHLDGRTSERSKVHEWLVRCARHLRYDEERTRHLRGAIFEARQGYKSADAKRVNADLQFARHADASNYLPVLSVISNQVSQSVIRRYRNSKMLVMTGNASADSTVSTYAFFREVVGFELDRFFERNSEQMRERCRTILAKLLTPA